MDGKIPSQNLIRQVNIESPVRQPSFYKPLVFDVITALSAFGLGYEYLQYLLGQTDITILVLTAGIFSVLSTLQIFFTKSLNRIFLFAIIDALAITSLFYFSGYDLKILAAAAFAFIVFFFWGGVLGRMELENTLEIGFFKTSGQILKKLTTAIAIVLVLVYLPRLSDNSAAFLSKTSFQSIFDKTAVFLNNFYPQVDFTSSLQKVSDGFAELELQNNATFQGLSQADKNTIITQTSQQIIDNLSKQLGTAISASDTVSNVFYDFIINLIGKWKDGNRTWFLVGWVLVVFFIVRSIGIIFYWIIGFIAFILYQILLSSGFIHILGETRTHEILEF
ncbi:MAG: hypothetical protein KGJ89_01910 [Patescibacteria group bacterium]|nr:hypothetical protein [Patescibacteria group bacterium]MDE2015633.1 hypothetical protein [Patescibacteria group bacterium]MDE2226690.1 hypothetical protein [Patescibacteria group bacterium]